MGRVTHTKIEAGQSRRVATLNTLFEDLETETAALSAANLARHGLDHESFAGYAARETWWVSDTTPVGSARTAPAIQQCGSGPTDLELDFTSLVGGAGLVLGARDWLKVTAAVQWTNGGTSVGIPAGLQWVVASIARDVGAGYVDFNTRRQGSGAVGAHACQKLRAAWSGAMTVERVALRSYLAGGLGGTFYGGYGCLRATVYRECG